MSASIDPEPAPTARRCPGTVVSEHFAGSTSLLRVRLDRLDVLVDAQRIQEADASAPGHDAGDRVEIVLTPGKVLVVD